MGSALDSHAGDCLDANAGQVYNGGQVIQYACDNGYDPYAEWIEQQDGDGWVQLMNYGDMLYNHVAMCLDAYGGPPPSPAMPIQYNGAPIIQYACNGNDPWQTWASSRVTCQLRIITSDS